MLEDQRHRTIRGGGYCASGPGERRAALDSVQIELLCLRGTTRCLWNDDGFEGLLKLDLIQVDSSLAGENLESEIKITEVCLEN